MKIAIRVNNWIGDVVMNIPAIEKLREAYPDAQIVAIARPWVTQLLEFRPDLIDGCIAFDDRGVHKGVGGFLRFCKQLRGEKFQLGVVFTKHLKGALMMRLAGIPKRWGLKTSETKLFLNGGVAFKTLPKGSRHQSENYLDVVAAGLKEPLVPLKPALKRNRVAERSVLQKFLPNLQRPLLCVHAGAAYGTAKRWSSKGYAGVITKFLNEFSGTAVLLGVASESDVNQEIQTHVNHERLVNLCGKTSLNESLTLIGASQNFLSNDSGLMHVAGAFGVAQVAIFGPTDVSATYPHNPKASVIYHKVSCSPCFKRHCPIGHDCMKAVSDGEVWDALQALVEKPGT